MTSRFAVEITLCSGLFLGSSGCTREPRSEIVAMAERAGSGKLSSTPAPQIEEWLRNHRDLAVQIDDQCSGVRPKADANWPVTTEGRVCTAARNAAMFYRQLHSPPPANGEKFGPGLH
jgi:hypothetical protein